VQASPSHVAVNNVNATDRDGDTALIRAASLGDYQKVKSLIAEGADVNIMDKGCSTALLGSLYSGSPECTRLLLDAHAKVNYKDRFGQTPLTYACSIHKANVDSVKLIIEAGADLNVSSKIGTALACASLYGYTDRVKLLIASGAKVNTHDPTFGETPLLCAAGKDNTLCTIALIDAGADVQAKDSQGRTPLMFSSLLHNIQAVNALIKAGANVNAEDKKGLTVLMCATTPLCVNTLVTAGAHVNATNPKGVTALMTAAITGNGDCVQALLDNGADPNIKTPAGRTALSLATAPAVIAILTKAMSAQASTQPNAATDPQPSSKSMERKNTP